VGSCPCADDESTEFERPPVSLVSDGGESSERFFADKDLGDVGDFESLSGL
jgi:hypothetical protein